LPQGASFSGKLTVVVVKAFFQGEMLKVIRWEVWAIA
jgi:hypothetical protein